MEYFIVHIWKYVTWLMLLPNLLNPEPFWLWKNMERSSWPLVHCLLQTPNSKDWHQGKATISCRPMDLQSGKGAFYRRSSWSLRVCQVSANSWAALQKSHFKHSIQCHVTSRSLSLDSERWDWSCPYMTMQSPVLLSEFNKCWVNSYTNAEE